MSIPYTHKLNILLSFVKRFHWFDKLLGWSLYTLYELGVEAVATNNSL